MKPVGAVVLAAGLGTRMGQAPDSFNRGQAKQLLQWGDKPMVRHVVDTLAAGGVEVGVVVVVGHQREAVEAALAGSAARSVYNPDYADGNLMRSLQVGLRAVQLSGPAPDRFDRGPVPDAILAALSDQPQITASVVRRVIEQWRISESAVLVPTYRQTDGHPVLFARSVWAVILTAPPTGSPRAIVQAHPELVQRVELGDEAILRDIDTPADYRRELERRV